MFKKTIISALMASTMITSACSTTMASSTSVNGAAKPCSEYPLTSRMNPTDLTDRHVCIIQNYRTDQNHGDMAFQKWVRINNKIYSVPHSELRLQRTVEKARAHFEKRIIEQLRAEASEHADTFSAAHILFNNLLNQGYDSNIARAVVESQMSKDIKFVETVVGKDVDGKDVIITSLTYGKDTYKFSAPVDVSDNIRQIKEIAALENRILKAITDIQNAKAELDTEVKRHDQTKAKLATAEKYHNDLVKHVNDAQKALSEANSTLAKEYANHATTKSKLNQANQGLSRTQTELGIAHKNYAEEFRAHQTTKTKLEQANVELKQTQADRDQAKQKHTQTVTELNKAKTDLKVSEKKVADTKADLEAATTAHQAAKDAVKQAQADLQANKDKLAATQVELDKVKADLKVSEGKSVDAIAARDAAQAAVTQAQNDLTAAKDKNKAMQAELDKAKADVAKANKAAEDAKWEAGKWKFTNEYNEKQNARIYLELQNEHDKWKNEATHYKNQVTDALAKMAEKEKRLQSAKHGLHNLLIDYNIKDISKVSTLVDDFVNKDYDMTNPSKEWTDAYNAFKNQLADLIVAKFVSLPGLGNIDAAIAKSKLDPLSSYSDPTETTQVPTTKPAFTDNNAIPSISATRSWGNWNGRQFELLVNGKVLNISTGVNNDAKVWADVIAKAVWAEGLEHGFGVGYEQGFDKGYDQGYDKGYDDGYKDGYDDGFRDGVKSVSK